METAEERKIRCMKKLAGLARLHRLFSHHPLTCDAPLRPWVRFIKWQLLSRLQHEVVHKWIGNQRLVVRRGMTGATGNIYVGLHEFFDMVVPLHFLRPNDLFLDIGANVGTYTVLAAGVCRADTCAFEPDPDTLLHLKRNLEINRLDERVRVFDCAVGEASKEVAFTVGLDTVNRLDGTGIGKTRMVPMKTLDELVSGANPAMMKVDVEGAELRVLSGAKQVLADPSLKVIELETVVPETIEILSRNGFEMASYDPFHRSLTKPSSTCQSSNALFVRDWAFVAERLRTAAEIAVFDHKI